MSLFSFLGRARGDGRPGGSWRLGLCLGLVGLVGQNVASAFPKREFLSGAEIIERVTQLQTAQTEAELIQMVLVDETGAAQQRQFVTLYRRSEGQLPQFLLRFLQPEEISGVTLLGRPDAAGRLEQFLFLPALGDSRRIDNEGRGGYFMGSDFTFDDLREEDMGEHRYTRMMDSVIDGLPVYVVMSAPATVDVMRDTGYVHRIFYVSKADFSVRRVEFFDADMVEPTKTLDGERFGVWDGSAGSVARPARITMRNHRRGTTTILTLQGVAVDLVVPEAWFALDNLGDWSVPQAALLGLLARPVP